MFSITVVRVLLRPQKQLSSDPGSSTIDCNLTTTFESSQRKILTILKKKTLNPDTAVQAVKEVTKSMTAEKQAFCPRLIVST